MFSSTNFSLNVEARLSMNLVFYSVSDVHMLFLCFDHLVDTSAVFFSMGCVSFV